MARLSASLLVLLLAAGAAVALSSCGGGGSSGLLPGTTASQINSNLDRIPELVAAGECADAQEATAEISVEIEALDGVNGRLKEALSEGAVRLHEVVSTCEELPEGELEETKSIEAAEEAAGEEEAPEKRQKAEKPGTKIEPEKQEKEATEPQPPPAEEKEVAPPAEEGGGNAGGIGPAAPAGGE